MEYAAKIQLKAGKCDVLFRMLDSFNQNSVHVTVTWKMMYHQNGKNREDFVSQKIVLMGVFFLGYIRSSNTIRLSYSL